MQGFSYGFISPPEKPLTSVVSRDLAIVKDFPFASGVQRADIKRFV